MAGESQQLPPTLKQGGQQAYAGLSLALGIIVMLLVIGGIVAAAGGFK